MIKSYYKVYRVFPDPEYVWLKNEYTSAAKFITKSAMKSPINLEYSLDKRTWNNYDMSNKPTISVPAGGYVYLRGVNTGVTFDQYNLHFEFSLNENFSTGGDIRTLFNYDDVNSITKIPDNAFIQNSVSYYKMTSCTWDMSGITEIGNYGFYNYFKYYNSLTTAPDFSNVTTVGESGFDGCFENCTSLTTAPDFSKVTSAGNYAFSSCFRNCTSLTTGPNFSNITTVGSNGFQHCFNGCTSLNLATAPNITEWSTSKFNSWLNNVASSGVVRKPAALTIPTDSTSGVPTGWTTENY